VPADLFAIGIANATVKANRTNDVAVVGELATTEGRALIGQGGTPLIASVDQGFADLGLYTLALAMDLHDGKPIPSNVTTAAKVIDKTNLTS
jgi:ABC-type sugar transport system substrate-binding protein